MKSVLLFTLVALVSPLRAGQATIGDPHSMVLSGLAATASVAAGSGFGFYVTDDSSNALNHYDAGGNLVSSISSVSLDGTATALGEPSGVVVDPSGNVWVADADNDRVLEFDSNGVFLTQLGTSADAGALNWPNDLAVGPSNRLYVADTGNNRIAVYDRSSGAFLFSWGTFGFGSGDDNLATPLGLCVSGNQVLVADTGNARVQIYDLDGHFQQTLGGRGIGEGSFSAPVGVAVDAQDRIWVADNGRQDVQIFSASGSFISGVGVGFDGFDFDDPTYLYAEADGSMVLADGYANRIFVWDSSVTGMRTGPKSNKELSQAPLTVGPVPARSGQALMLVLPAAPEHVSWQIYTADMRLVGEVSSGGQSIVTYNQTAGLAAGVYLSKVSLDNNGGHRTALQKIVITR
jgi:DNA-binding beta-propeller fold protein YncE